MYKLVGADRKEYGPVSQETVLEWIAQGRANAQSIARFEDQPWKPLGTFEEFKGPLGFASASPASPQATNASAPGEATLLPPAGAAPEPLPFSGVNSRRSTNIPAVLGLVFPIACCCCAYVGPILGIIFSLVGISQIRQAPQRYSTHVALAQAGLGVSIFVLILHLLGSILDFQLSKYFRLPL